MIPVGFCLGTFGTSYAALREAARLIDDTGFDSIWLWDHYVSWNDPREPVLECWATLASLAEATTRVKLGPLVANNTNRHPGRLAKVAATLHELSGGRSELGLGAGGLVYEQAPFGIEQGERSERFGRLKEAVQVIPALWSGEPVSFTGQYYQLDQAICAPAADPAPRVILGAIGPGIARLAGRYTGGANLHWQSRNRFPELFDAIDQGLAAGGRDRKGFDISLHPMWPDFSRDPLGLLETWERQGFTRALVYVAPPFPLAEIEGLARTLTR